MRNKIAVVLGLLLSANTAIAELKIGFVNIPAVLENAPQAESAKNRLEKEFSPRDKQLLAQQKEIQQLEERMTRDGAVMSESERRDLEKNILNKQRELKRHQQEFGEDFNIRRNEELGKLQRKVVEAIRSLAKEQNFDLLLTDGVIFASDKIDVTNQVKEKMASSSE